MKSWARKLLVSGVMLGTLSLSGMMHPQAAVYAVSATATNLTELQTGITNALNSHLTSYAVSYSGNLSTLQTDINNALNAAIASDDYLHYTVKTYAYSASSSAGVATINFTFTYWETQAQTDYVKSQVTQILGQIITADMNAHQKEKAIHDWIITHVAYDTTKVSHSAYDGLANGKTVCQGYALLTYEMMRQAGIPVKIEEGVAHGEAHAWNLVQLDGQWYQLDCTWDDPLPDVAGRTVYNYFNLTDAQLKADHSWTKSYPAATTSYDQTLSSLALSDTANATFYNSLFQTLGFQYLNDANTATSVQNLTNMIQSAVWNRQSEVIVRYTNGATVAADIKTAMAAQTGLSGYSYSYVPYTRTTINDQLVDLKFTYASNTVVPVTGISLPQSTLSIKAGTTPTKLQAVFAPTNATNRNVTWTSSDSSIVKVDAYGNVSAVGTGTATITATSTDGHFTATCSVTAVVPVTSIALNKTTATIEANDMQQLTATISPTTATNATVTWSSSNNNIATVDANGVVHAVSPGTAVITATNNDVGTVRTAKCTVTVPTHASKVQLNTSSLTLGVGGATSHLTATVTPTNATNRNVTWSSSDTSVATVDASGNVKAIGSGTATITVTTVDGNLTATCTVTTVIPVTSLVLDKTTATVEANATQQLTATVGPTTATNKTITWSSSNPTVATVDANGLVHALVPGTAVITATNFDGVTTRTAKSTITVPVHVTSVQVNASTLTLGVGGASGHLTATIMPTNATVRNVTWSSSNTSVATVDASGNVKAVGLGTATITATTVDGNFTATSTVTTVIPVSSLTLNLTTATIEANATQQLSATVGPTTATNKTVTWSSSNSSVATVDANGVVHAIAPGTAVITATNFDGVTTRTAKATITVPLHVTKVQLNVSTLSLNVGTLGHLIATLTPTNSTTRNVTWSTSDATVATVDANGYVKGLKSGTVTITVTTV
ncbi:MAG: Ig-like domain-containing protein, partial [Tumebacillaceae bacterium]